eukprot:3402596-Prymnesium_polylepis.1
MVNSLLVAPFSGGRALALCSPGSFLRFNAGFVRRLETKVGRLSHRLTAPIHDRTSLMAPIANHARDIGGTCLKSSS